MKTRRRQSKKRVGRKTRGGRVWPFFTKNKEDKIREQEIRQEEEIRQEQKIRQEEEIRQEQKIREQKISELQNATKEILENPVKMYAFYKQQVEEVRKIISKISEEIKIARAKKIKNYHSLEEEEKEKINIQSLEEELDVYEKKLKKLQEDTAELWKKIVPPMAITIAPSADGDVVGGKRKSKRYRKNKKRTTRRH
jgi:hypothetical protein